MGTNEEMQELGLTKTCGQIEPRQVGSQILRDRCGKPTIAFGGLCSKHDPGTELLKQEKVALQRIAVQQRLVLEEELLPKATERILRILDNEDAKDADVIKVWGMIMDRVGLAATTNVAIEADVKFEAPLDILRAMLRPTPGIHALAEVVDGEVVEDGQTP